jgi:glycosyltransferase involved in cell wall biosynthesis
MAKQEFPYISCIMLAGNVPLQEVKNSIVCFKQQTYKNKELLIINNVNNQTEAGDLKLPKSKLYRIIDTPSKLTAGLARNIATTQARGSIIAQWDTNFWYAPRRLEAQLANMAEYNAPITLLSRVMSYSYCSGESYYYSNNNNSILGTIMYIHSLLSITYANQDKYEEVELLTRAKSNSIVSLDAPQLACKLHFSSLKPAPPKASQLNEADFQLIADALGLIKGKRRVKTENHSCNQS